MFLAAKMAIVACSVLPYVLYISYVMNEPLCADLEKDNTSEALVLN